MQYGQFGAITFEVFSFKEFTEESKYAYAEQKTIYAPSSLQFIGKELRKIELTLRFHNQFCDPEAEYEKFKQSAEEGSAQKLVIASRVIGDFVIEEILGEFIQIDAWGKPVLVEVSVELKEYVEKALKTVKNKPIQKAPAVKKRADLAEVKVVEVDGFKKLVRVDPNAPVDGWMKARGL